MYEVKTTKRKRVHLLAESNMFHMRLPLVMEQSSPYSSRFMDPLSDYGFKYIFGKPATERDKWAYLLKHLGRMQSIPPALEQGVFREVLEIAEISNLSKEEYNMYRSSLQDQADYENALAYAKQEASEQGHQQGLEQGLEQGLKEGEKRKELAVVQTMVTGTGFDDQEIAALAGVKETFVRSIRAKIRA